MGLNGGVVVIQVMKYWMSVLKMFELVGGAHPTWLVPTVLHGIHT